MLLYERGLFDLDAPVSAIVPEFIHDAAKDPRRHEVTLRMLLSHSSGLPAYEKLFLKARTRDRTSASRLHHPASRRSRHPRRLQRHRIHNPRHRPRTPGRRIPRPLLPARNLRPASHDQHNLQSPTRNPRKDSPHSRRTRRAECGAGALAREMPGSHPRPPSGSQPAHPAAPSAKESSKAKSRTKTPASSAA